MYNTSYRTNTCGELTLANVGEEVTLSGWIQRSRDLGGMTFIDLRDKYGITQLVFDIETNKELCKKARKLGREYVIQATGKVRERSNKNKSIPTGDIEIETTHLLVLNTSLVPPFTIEDNTDGGDELRMQYRYLDLRRNSMKKNIELRHKMTEETRKYMYSQGFIEIETPVLIKSTPEGARDFVVPSRMHPGQFYALPQSPQTFKQLLMIAGYDKYMQIVKCFRDEDFRADRQPEFTQIDCEMSFVTMEDVVLAFEGLAKHLFTSIKGIEMQHEFPILSYKEAIENYGTDKPDIRFEMKIKNMTQRVKGKGFYVLDKAEYVGGICVKGCADYSRKQLDELTAFVQKPQIGAKGLIYVKYNEDKSIKSSVDKFYSINDLKEWIHFIHANKGDLLLILAGEKMHTLNALSKLRLEMAERLRITDKNTFAPLWIIDFPLLEWDEESQRFYAKHHPFTSPKKEDINLLDKNPAEVRANAYDLVINGVEIGGGSIRIHDKKLQEKMFDVLGFSEKEAQQQFGFLMNAFQYGAPPHGGIAFGFDRWVSLFAGLDSIRDVIAFPKNNTGKDIMIYSPSEISDKQLKELSLKLTHKNK